MSTCALDGCDRPLRCKGLCNAHYKRLREQGSVGSVEARPNLRGMPLIDRLFARIEVDASGCWIYTGCIAPVGYGQIGSGGVVLYTHRVSYELHEGPIPNGLHIDHLCRNRACCNPEHLEPVTQAENNRRAGGPRQKTKDAA